MADNVTQDAPDVAKNTLGGRNLPKNPGTELSKRDPEDKKTTTENKDGEEKQSLRINIKLDLDVEVHLTARIKGDITIGLL
ncbi:hypothetical protein D6D28_03034 [Aureobasidium pullulans]|uniref:Uncharacterized protein n=1 Tax=Aureobasidium pullulans TaxID=5580 RepID=A0A4S8SRV1_AURPU|nr:hypothetical protein D6D28_03034 [Aureobasidium pullulans]